MKIKDQLSELTKLIRKLLWYFFPLLLLFILLEYVSWRTGETVPLAAIAKWQDEGNDRMWRGGDGRSYLTYKLERIRKNKPEIIFLGSSRANSFRQEDFLPYKFYNASLCGWTFDHYLRFTQLVTNQEYTPKIIFFNMDFFVFSSDPWWNDLWVDRFYEKPETHTAAVKMVADYILKSTDWPFSNKVKPSVFPGQPDPNIKLWQKLKNSDNLKGLFAILSGSGFRKDGALLEYRVLTADEKRLEVDGCVLPKGGDLGAYQMKKFEEFASFAKSKNIKLIGVHMPLADRQLKIQELESNNPLWLKMRSKQMYDYYEKNGVLFLDFADMPEYRKRPERFLDSLHPDVEMVTDIASRILSDDRVKTIFSQTKLSKQ